MTPNPNSRVSLADSSDTVFHQKQSKITWELTEADEQIYKKSAQLFKEAVDNLGGDIDITPWEYVKNQLVINGHHIGTTRMSDKPEEGVVDPNLKVHSLDNLYVAGASVFPTAAISNPTFTIIALSIRLADHLSQKLSNGG